MEAISQLKLIDCIYAVPPTFLFSNYLFLFFTACRLSSKIISHSNISCILCLCHEEMNEKKCL